MAGYIFDLESNGLLPRMDTIHSLVLKDVETGEVISCANQEGYTSIDQGLELLAKADLLVGHNIIKFDIPGICKVRPDWAPKEGCGFYDTLVTSRLFWPELTGIDHAKWSHIGARYIGRHSLAAWGERLGVQKIKFAAEQKEQQVEDVWAMWSESMQHYCEQDVVVSDKLYRYMAAQDPDPRSMELEHKFAIVMAKQEQFGFPFNETAAHALVNFLRVRRSEIDEELQKVFPPIVEERISEKTGKKLKSKVTVFNPASRQQTAERLKILYPEITFGTTGKGNPNVDDDVLEGLGEKYPEAKLLAEYQLLNKRIGQIAEGKEAWLKHCTVYNDGRIHGEVVTNACISGRCSHKRPNMAQVPSVGHPYGADCRALFYAPDGWVLVGADAAGLELRALGAWLAYYDGGQYARLVSTEGFDIHTHNARLFGIYDGKEEITKATRDLSKRLIYALLYGAGASKVGSVIDILANSAQQYESGRKTIDTFYTNLPAIKQLKDDIEKRIGTRGYLIGADGRRLQIRSKHSALNQLLQSTGAILVKKATTILYDDLNAAGLVWGEDYAFVAHIHDEVQTLVRPQHVELYKKLAIDSFRKSGEYFKLRCPFTGEAREGKNWMETH